MAGSLKNFSQKREGAKKGFESQGKQKGQKWQIFCHFCPFAFPSSIIIQAIWRAIWELMSGFQRGSRKILRNIYVRGVPVKPG